MTSTFRLPVTFLAAAAASGCALPPAASPLAPPLSGEIVVRWSTPVGTDAEAAIRGQAHPDAVTPLTPGMELWRVDPARSEALLTSLNTSPAVQFATVNRSRRLITALDGLRPPAFGGWRLLSAEQWHLEDAHFPGAWSYSRGAGVTVAVIDSGVDPNHPDLKANLLPLIDEVVAMGRRDVVDGNKNFDGRDSHGHGTHVAGLIAAEQHEGWKVTGGAPEAKILPVKVTPLSGETDDATIAKGIRDAVDKGARVLNLSIGGPDPSPILLEALNYALLKGALPVIAAGNDGGKVNYPAAYGGVAAVGALTESGAIASYSCRGEGLVLVAPGGGQPYGQEGRPLHSTMPTYPAFGSNAARAGTGYGVLGGTSMAAPLVSAAAALVIARNPSFTAPQVRTRLAATTGERESRGWEPASGFGSLNAEQALSAGEAP